MNVIEIAFYALSIVSACSLTLCLAALAMSARIAASERRAMARQLTRID